MAKVTILVLEGCSRCNALKNKLGYLNIRFKYLPCDGPSEFCDQAETLSGVDSYPMAIVTDINDKISEIVYFTDEYDKVGKKQKLVDGVVGVPVYSVDQLADYIIKS